MIDYLTTLNRLSNHHTYKGFVYSVRNCVNLVKVIIWAQEVSAKETAGLSLSDPAISIGYIFACHFLRENFDFLWAFVTEGN